MFNVHVRSFSVPTHRQIVVPLVQVEDGDADLYMNYRMRCVILCIVTVLLGDIFWFHSEGLQLLFLFSL